MMLSHRVTSNSNFSILERTHTHTYTHTHTHRRQLCIALEPLAGLARLFSLRKWMKIRSMLKKHPFLYKENHGDLGSSLHLAITLNAPEDIVLSLVENYPRATFVTDKEGMTPLHLATKFGRQITFSTFLAILKKNPIATRCADKVGKLPLHHAVQVLAPPIIIAALYFFYPKAVNIEDSKSKCPLTLLITTEHRTYGTLLQEILCLLLSTTEGAQRVKYDKMRTVSKISDHFFRNESFLSLAVRSCFFFSFQIFRPRVSHFYHTHRYERIYPQM